MSTTQRESILYGFFALCGVLAPWIWLTGFVCYCLDKIVWYLAKGREQHIQSLLDKRIKSEIEPRLNSLEKENLELKLYITNLGK